MHGSYGSPDGNWFRWLESELKGMGHETILEQFPVDSWDEVESIGRENIGTYKAVESLESWEKYFVAHISCRSSKVARSVLSATRLPQFLFCTCSPSTISRSSMLFLSLHFSISQMLQVFGSFIQSIALSIPTTWILNGSSRGSLILTSSTATMIPT